MKIIDWWNSLDTTMGIKLKDVPLEYQESFNKAMVGQTCLKDEQTNEFIFYPWDVQRWVNANKDI